MSDDSSDAGDAELGAEIDAELTPMIGVLGDAYRGELDRETTWRSRLDQTTTWTVTVIAAILTWAFSSPDNPHYVLLVAMVVAAVFLLVEARRYRDYDVYRARVRLFQQNLLADALDPESGVTHDDWRVELGDDYRRPTRKVSIHEAVSNRLRRIYAPLLFVLLVAWLVRITAFAPGEVGLDAAAVGTIPGIAVVAAIVAFYATVIGVLAWPRERQAKEEFRDGEHGEWKDA
ncbi:DUF2270 domain-containing protein [Halovivax limisalsi]|uniref:DUF2270 domain-containing protein n=1 Tax=Halovivax limisalsi TaxID=1453760 RepID=UPI001FFC63EF|nr:DUF2270 domain-containing protein [Halovivax limisalsi]